FPRRDDGSVVGKAQIVTLDFFRIAQQLGSEASRQCGFADALGTCKQQCLRNPVLRDHALERFRHVSVAPEVFKHAALPPPRLWPRPSRARFGRRSRETVPHAPWRGPYTRRVLCDEIRGIARPYGSPKLVPTR